MATELNNLVHRFCDRSHDHVVQCLLRKPTAQFVFFQFVKTASKGGGDNWQQTDNLLFDFYTSIHTYVPKT